MRQARTLWRIDSRIVIAVFGANVPESLENNRLFRGSNTAGFRFLPLSAQKMPKRLCLINCTAAA